MNKHEIKIFDYLNKCDGHESYLNDIARHLAIDKSDALDALKSLTSDGVLVKRKEGKKIIYQTNPNYRDHLLELLDNYKSRLEHYEEEINKSIRYLKNKKLFSKDTKFRNKTIRENVEAIIRYSKAIMDVITQIRYIEIFSTLDTSHLEKTLIIQRKAFGTLKDALVRFKSGHMDEQQVLSTYLEFQIPVLYIVG